MARALDEAAAAGFSVYGAAGDARDGKGSNALAWPLRLPALLVLGGEERGLRPLVRRHCERLLFVPMLREVDSLNVAQAGGILIALFLRRHLEGLPAPSSSGCRMH
jgi:23S rRNA (guanosine2251-2'-O)-methyltransferase